MCTRAKHQANAALTILEAAPGGGCLEFLMKQLSPGLQTCTRRQSPLQFQRADASLSLSRIIGSLALALLRDVSIASLCPEILLRETPKAFPPFPWPSSKEQE